MKNNMLIAVFLFCWANFSWATCEHASVSLTHDQHVTLGEMFPLTGQETFNMTARFSGIKCSSANDVINYIPIASDKQAGPFSNGEIVKVTVTVPKTSETIGTTSTTEKIVTYTVKIEHDSFSSTSIGGQSIIVPGVMAANTGGNSTWLINLILGLCKALSWSACVDNINNSLSGDTYIENLVLNYHPKTSTCKPDDLTITLPDIPLSGLSAVGKVGNKNADGTIRLTCDNLLGSSNQSSRKMAVHIYSGDLLTGSSFILRGAADNGVGFVLDQGGKTINITRIYGSEAAADSLLNINKKEVVNGNNTIIPITASYYVYDRDKIKPGVLKATALIYMKYD